MSAEITSASAPAGEAAAGLQLDHHALGGFAAYAGNLCETGYIIAANGGNQFFDAHAGENLQSERGSDARGREKHFEEMLFAGGNEAVEGECIFADVGVDEKRDFGVEFAEGGVGGERDLD
jgi:hypothetical protein